MHFNDHYKIRGAHSFLSPSSASWVNYTEDKLIERYTNHREAARGTALHEYAEMAIRLKRKQPRNNQTLNMYVNDALGFRMQPEVMLFYSVNCFGTVDAISFKETDMKLRIHDLKNGITKASMVQLRIYAALFCLEYGYTPEELDTELRIYQNDEVIIENPEPEVIDAIIEKIPVFDKLIEQMKEDAFL